MQLIIYPDHFRWVGKYLAGARGSDHEILLLLYHRPNLVLLRDYARVCAPLRLSRLESPWEFPTTIICVYSFILYVPKQQPCKMWGVFLQLRESNLLSNTGHAAEITEQVFMWCFLPQREVNLPSNAGHAAEITEQVSPHHLLLHLTPLCSTRTHHNEQTQNLLCQPTQQ